MHDTGNWPKTTESSRNCSYIPMSDGLDVTLT
jgi:hypothetical protein